MHFYSPPKQPIAVLFIIAFTVFACDEQPTDSTTECASCEYDVDVYGGLMGAYYGDRLVSVNEELNAIIKINSNGDMTLVNDLNRVSVNLSQSVANKYKLRDVFLSGGVFDVTRKSVWLGVFWFGADIVSPRNDSTLVLEYDIESSTFTEHSIEHIYKGAYDSITRNRVTIVAGFWYGSELRLITNLGSHLSLIDGTLTLRTDDAFGMLTRTGFVIASDKLTASTLWHYITRLPETVHTMFNNKTVSIPELDQYESTVCDFDGPTRTFLVTTRVDSCRHRYKVTNMVFLSPRLDVCSIQRETSDSIFLKIDKSVSFTDLGCTIVYNERPPRFLRGVDNILFSGYKWGDPLIKLYTVSAAGVAAY